MEEKIIYFQGVRLLRELGQYLNIDYNLIFKKNGKDNVSTLRKIFIYYLREELKFSFKEISKIVGYDNHTSAIYAYKTTEQKFFQDENLLLIYHRSQKNFKPIKIVKISSRCKKIIQINKKGRIIKKWDSIQIAARSIGVSRTAIKNSIYRDGYCRGCKWKFE